MILVTGSLVTIPVRYVKTLSGADLTNVIVTITYPAGVGYDSSVLSSGAVVGGITWTIPTLSSGEANKESIALTVEITDVDAFYAGTRIVEMDVTPAAGEVVTANNHWEYEITDLSCPEITACLTTNISTVNLTKAEADALIAAEEVVPGINYRITDRGDVGIILKGIDNDKLSISGTRIMLVPKSYVASFGGDATWLGPWTPTLTPSTGDKCIFNGHVWENNAGAVGSISDPEDPNGDISADWTRIEKTAFTDEYIEMLFSIEYDYDNDWISLQSDQYDNVIGCPYDLRLSLSMDHNPVDYTDWNLGSVPNSYLRGNRVARGIHNNGAASVEGNISVHGGIFNNIGGITIQYNVVSNNIMNNIDVSDIFGNRGISTTISNAVATISSNTGMDRISLNEFEGKIDNNDSGQIVRNKVDSIYNNTGTGIIENNVADEILDNTLGGNIRFNTCPTSTIEANACTGAIEGNTCEWIYDNTCANIRFNNIPGHIDGNSHDGDIKNNQNNGDIVNCTGAGGFHVQFNINNGDINNPAGLGAGNIEDSIVNK